MNLRDIKKDIEYVIGEFIEDCSLFIAINPLQDAEKVAPLIDEAVDLYNYLKNKANNPAPEENLKKYYTALRMELLAKVDELCEKLSATIAA